MKKEKKFNHQKFQKKGEKTRKRERVRERERKDEKTYTDHDHAKMINQQWKPAVAQYK